MYVVTFHRRSDEVRFLPVAHEKQIPYSLELKVYMNMNTLKYVYMFVAFTW